MKRNVLIIMAATAILFAGSKTMDAQNTRDNGYIETSARVQREVTPDEIYMTIRLDEEQTRGKVTIAQQEKALLSTLEKIGIPKENLTVDNMESSLHKFIFKSNKTWATKDLRLKVATAEQMAEAFSQLNAAGIPEVDFESATVSAELERKVKNELLVEAAQQAKENAKVLAGALDSEIGKPIYAQNYFDITVRSMAAPMLKSTMLRMNSLDSEEVEESSVEISKQRVSLSVTCRFEIK